jgi:predicted dehydrogenase
MKNTNRREFLKSSATVAAGVAAFATPAIAKARAGANDRIRVGMVGLGGRMSGHIACLHELADEENVEIAAICDCDARRLESAAGRYPELEGKKPVAYTDQRELFDDKSIDAVSFATQDHWHALQTIWACQAGKDVYVEKPGTHDLFEGRQMVAAARKYKRMVQHGTQCRSNPVIREGIRKLKEGLIGDIFMARAIDFKPRGNLGKNKPTEVPDGLDWDRWVGPAPMVPYSDFRRRRWYWMWEFASGSMANQAIHNLDIARWGMDLESHPAKIQSMGGHFVHDDDIEMPNHQTFACQYDDGRIVQFEARSWITNDEAKMRDTYQFVVPGQAVGNIFLGTQGYMIIPNYNSYHTFLGRGRKPGPSRVGLDMSANRALWKTESIPHFRNWIAAIRSRNHEDLNAEIEQGRMSMALSLLGNVAFRTGRTLQFDGKTEQCVGDDEANKLLTPEYRKPYVVPEEV